MPTEEADFLLESYNFELPESQIAQFPPEERGASRLLIMPREGALELAPAADEHGVGGYRHALAEEGFLDVVGAEQGALAHAHALAAAAGKGAHGGGATADIRAVVDDDALRDAPSTIEVPRCETVKRYFTAFSTGSNPKAGA